ncbi:coxsackievirus and adenovirus receptor-like [Channa argus]|uniref:coxsackievirus and adenovirus receptor-like n=1 Tax=Channa argus TaxID=215402 RepID=UPI0035218AE7
MKLDHLKFFKEQKEKMATLKRTLFLCLLICFFTNGLTEEIQAKSGDDVILHCRDPSNANILVLRWIRPDLKAKGYVYFFRESRSYEQYQYPSFHGRVKLRDPQMKDGDFSVILNHFSINDTGTYECYVGRNNTGSDPEIINIIHLKVKADQEDITAKSGDHVTLPCHVPQNTQILVVEWIRPDLEPEYVFLYKNGQSHPDHQHPSFRNRVELKDSGMKDGNLSVILKNVTITDTGTYECHIYQSQRNHTMSIINLDVHQPDLKVEGKPGDNVTLQCQGTEDFTKFKWKKTDLKSEYYVCFFSDKELHKRYQHESFQDRVELKDPNMKNRDASVILKNININDAGTYECYVGYGGRSELITTITLKVIDSGADERGGDKDGHVGLIVGLSVVVVLVVVAGFMIYGRCRRLKQNQLPAEAADHELQDLNQRN